MLHEDVAHSLYGVWDSNQVPCLITEHGLLLVTLRFPRTWVWGVRVVGGDSGEGPPGPIPNPVAKLPSADGTALGRVWESKTPPTHYLERRLSPS